MLFFEVGLEGLDVGELVGEGLRGGCVLDEGVGEGLWVGCWCTRVTQLPQRPLAPRSAVTTLPKFKLIDNPRVRVQARADVIPHSAQRRTTTNTQ